MARWRHLALPDRAVGDIVPVEQFLQRQLDSLTGQQER
jgi:hypothetical protein